MYKHLKIGQKFPKIVNVIIEIPKNTSNKYEYDENLGLMKLDRVLHSPVFYPVDYGFIPETHSPDGDHLDIMVITNSPVFPGCFLEARPLGALIMSDDKGQDEKIIAVPLKNPEYDHYQKLSDISPHFLKEIEHFFAEYKRLEKCEDAVVKGWINRLESYQVIRTTHRAFHKLEHSSENKVK